MPVNIDELVNLGGHIYDEANIKGIIAQQTYPHIAGANQSIKGTGRGQSINLAEFVIKVFGKWPSRTQTIGDCVSQGCAGGVDILKAIDIVNNTGEFLAPTSSAAIYALARHECGNDAWRGSDGASGASGAAACKFGTLIQKKYLDKYDLTNYDGNLARRWGDSGLPDDLEPIAREHNVKSISQVSTYYECIDLLYSGHVVTVASNVGFDNNRDRNGKILRNSLGIISPASTWNHQLLFLGYIDDNKPRCLCMNSWGDWCAGGPSDMIVGSFYIEAEVVERMLKQGDSFAMSSFAGYPLQKLNLRLL